MNYLELIVGFHRWKEVNPLPASAIALWHELVAVCNKAGWPEEFTVPNAVLQANAGLSRKEFDRARQLLIEFGLFQYRKSNRVDMAGRYKIVGLFKRDNDTDNQRGNDRDNGRDNQKGNDRDNYKDLKDQNLNVNENKKRKYAEFVSMTDDEYHKLVDVHGSDIANACITELDNYKGASGKKYKSDYRAILTWVADKVLSKKKSGQPASGADLALKLIQEAEERERIGNQEALCGDPEYVQ
ncbi:hypothetical protein [Paenibacillus tyrfis]|uniref:hypothetical protein n=1 Tax=Paenibacillus tyrfis TaxID=1501230 RepID=UPI000B59133D|nr:hypothetical protein [Paenibacillus tyrfis]